MYQDVLYKPPIWLLTLWLCHLQSQFLGTPKKAGLLKLFLGTPKKAGLLKLSFQEVQFVSAEKNARFCP
jgi:hypothetical protein